MKGLSPLIAAVLLVGIGMLAASLVFNWQSSIIGSVSGSLEKNTQEKFRCESSSLVIKNVSYNCNNLCLQNVDHILTVGLKNFGDTNLNIQRIQLVNSTGGIFSYSFNQSISIGQELTLTNTSRDSCFGINRTIDKVFVGTECGSFSFGGSAIQWINC